MSFSARVKEELSHQLSKARHCQIAELAAILSLCGKIHIDEEDHFSIRIHTENVAVARKYFTLLKNTFNIKADISIRRNAFLKKSRSYTLLVRDHENALRVLEAVKMVDAQGNVGENLSVVRNLVIQNACCKKAFIRGAFLENPTNVGAIFRSAAALFMDAVLLTPGCSDPLYRRASRVSMGTVFQVPWTYIPKGDWAENSMETLKKLGFLTAAMALSDRSVSIADPALSQEEKLAIILGTEGDGLAASTIAACDYTVKIPMSHGVDSLNVAAASAVAFWQLGMGNRK